MSVRLLTAFALMLPILASCGEAPEAGGERDTALEELPEPEHVSSENAARLIPRQVLFGNPERVIPELSPDGTMIAYVAPADGVLNLWVAGRDMEEPRQLTFDEGRGITSYRWAEDGEHILYMQDEAGEEDYHVYLLSVETGEVSDLTPYEGVRASISDMDRDHPHTVLIEMNREDPMFFDVYSADLRTGELTLVQDNPGILEGGSMVLGYQPDEDMRLRLRMTIDQSSGDITVWHRWDEASDWEELRTFSSLESWYPLRFTEEGEGLYVESNLGRDLSGLYLHHLESGADSLVFADSTADLGSVDFDPFTGEPRLASVTYLRRRVEVLDQSIADDVDFLEGYREGDWGIVSEDHADSTWIVGYTTIDNPVVYYLYDRTDGSMTELFSAVPALEAYGMAPMEPVEITARDGLVLPSYLTTPDPEHYGEGPYPLVMMVHGGPWARDYYGYDPFVQQLADRGFAVLKVNFRGSAGFGKEFINAGNREWGGAMQDDVTDAAMWAVEEGIADPERLVIFGGSYGGYAALAGAAFTPDLYCAAVDFFGPSNLVTFIESVPPYWRPMMAMFDLRVGDPDDPEDLAMLQERSPLNHADSIRVPLLVVQGANDPRVVIGESDQIVRALRDLGNEVLYVVYEDEGHGFAREENRLDFAGRVEEFLYLNVPGVECELFEPVEGAASSLR